MTHLDVCFRCRRQPGIEQMRAIDSMREVYGIRRIAFNEQEKTVSVEYDASRLSEAVVAGLLRHAGLDIEQKVALA